MRTQSEATGQAAQREPQGQMDQEGMHSQAARGSRKIHTQHTEHRSCIAIGGITIRYLKRSAQLLCQKWWRMVKHSFQPLPENIPETLIRPGRRAGSAWGQVTKRRVGQARSTSQNKGTEMPDGFSNPNGAQTDRAAEIKAKPLAILRPSLRPIPYRRLGEASHPGPTIRMPGDGHCLYHSLGWWASLSQAQVRDQLARVDWDTWNTVCPWDSGSELAEFRRETRDPRIWGGALQIAVCAAIHQVSIEVHTDFGKQSFGSGQLWGSDTPHILPDTTMW